MTEIDDQGNKLIGYVHVSRRVADFRVGYMSLAQTWYVHQGFLIPSDIKFSAWHWLKPGVRELAWHRSVEFEESQFCYHNGAIEEVSRGRLINVAAELGTFYEVSCVLYITASRGRIIDHGLKGSLSSRRSSPREESPIVIHDCFNGIFPFHEAIPACPSAIDA